MKENHRDKVNPVLRSILSVTRMGFPVVAASLFLSLLTPSLASAESVCVACIQIDDLTDELSVTTNLTSENNADINITQEGVGVLGAANIHFEYLSTSQDVPANGVSFTRNYNIFSFESPTDTQMTISDTLNVVITGHKPTVSDPNNVYVDIHFLSGSLDEIAPPGLANALQLIETGQYETVHAALGDLDINFRSDVSEVPVPAAAWLFGSGLLGLVGVARRKARTL